MQIAAGGGGKRSKTAATKDPKTGLPAPNTARNVWVTETALSTAARRTPTVAPVKPVVV